MLTGTDDLKGSELVTEAAHDHQQQRGHYIHFNSEVRQAYCASCRVLWSASGRVIETVLVLREELIDG